jgi:SET domain-containing protein
MKKCRIKRNQKKGRGVFSQESIKRGEIIEESQLILIPESELGDELSRFVFAYDKKTVAIPLGNGSLYNHSEQPNVTTYFDFKRQVLIFEALEDIPSSRELLIDYGYTQEEKRRYGIIEG